MKPCFAKGCGGQGVHVKLQVGDRAWVFLVRCRTCRASTYGHDRESAEETWEGVLRADDVIAAFDQGRRSVQSTERGSAVGSASGS